MRLSLLVLALAAALAGAGCGGDEQDAGELPAPTSSPVPAGGGISVEEALASDSEEPLLVRGSLVARGDDVRLCTMLAESHPPQCGGKSLRVEGLDLSAVDGLREADGVRWTAAPTALLGHVRDGVLEVSENVM